MEVSVCVDGKELREYFHKGSSYIAVDLYSKKAYVVEEADDSIVDGDHIDARHDTTTKLLNGIGCGIEPSWQRYTLNPFMIRIEKKCSCPVFVRVKLDGEVIQSRPLGRGPKKLEVDRMKHQGTLRELVFSLPRLTTKSVVPECRREELGSVEVVMEEAVEDGYYSVPATSVQWEPRTTLPTQPGFPQASKGDLRNVQARGSRTIVVRDGRLVGRLVRNSGRLVERVRYRGTGRLVAQKLLLYRSALVLQEMGILPPPPTLPHSLPGSGGDTEQEKPGSKKEEVEDFTMDDYPPITFTTEDLKTDKPFTGCVQDDDCTTSENKADGMADEEMKMEDGSLEESVIFVGYERYAVKREPDTSVVYMGDQDCFVEDRDLTVIQIPSDVEMEEDGTD